MIFKSSKSCLPPRVDTKTAETMAALGAVQFIKEVGFFDATFERDAARVI
jgi:hypothetical protein